jgi:nucleoside-diphosphate-sugar epimerase
MRVVVAGATGALGRSLVPALVANGHEVVAVVRPGAPAHPQQELWAGTIVADVLDREALLAAAEGIRADAVLHELTALKRLPLRYRDLDATDVLRTRGTANLLALAEAVGATRLVTQSFLGGYGYRDHGSTPLGEDAPFGAPARPAGLDRVVAALREAEERTLRTPGLDGVVLRYGLFYGPESIAAMRPALARRALPVPRGGGGTSSWVLLPDAAAATVAALERGRAGEAYNVADEQPVRWATFFDAVAEAVGAPRPLRLPLPLLRAAAPYGARVMQSSIPLSTAKARRELGFEPAAPTYREGLALAVG